MVSASALPTPSLLILAVICSAIVAAAAETSAVLLVPRTQRLSAKHQVIIVDDRRLHPAVGVDVDVARGRIHSAAVGHVVVRGF